MERRWSRRKQVELDVLLRYPGLGMVSCKTRDLGFEGANIITGSVALAPTAGVELIFSRPEDVAAAEVHLGAKVVRVHADGIGVNFSHYHDGAYSYLLKLLN